MTLQIIKSVDGKDEYVLLPMTVYRSLRSQIEAGLNKKDRDADYVQFDPADYVDNPIALARIKAHLTQEELAKAMEVSQAYVSKIERQSRVTPKLLERVKQALRKAGKKSNA